jgi:uncharacterized membrane protein
LKVFQLLKNVKNWAFNNKIVDAETRLYTDTSGTIDIKTVFWASHARSFIKAITWRLTGTIDTFVLTFIITKKLKFALAISTTEVFTKIFLYYVHERVWNKIKWGRK